MAKIDASGVLHTDTHTTAVFEIEEPHRHLNTEAGNLVLIPANIVSWLLRSGW